MEFLKNIEWTPLNILKAVAFLLVSLIILSVVVRIISPIMGVVFKNSGGFGFSSQGTNSVAPAMDGYAVDADYGYTEESAYGREGEVSLSARNIGIPTPQPGGSVGDDAEEYEATDYSASIEARNSDDTCSEILKLKALDHVVFENTNEHDRGCSFTFKVKRENVEEILAVIQSFNPENLSESTYTIKSQIDDFTSETEILEKKLLSIDDTLKNAISAYDEITILATRTQNVESLAVILNNKINLIERLTQERINTVAQLERLSRSKAEQLDRLEYSHFNINVYENKFIDGESLKESWKNAVRQFVFDVNRTLQDLSINLVALLFVLAQYVLYFFIVLIIVKYLWRGAQSIWRK